MFYNIKTKLKRCKMARVIASTMTRYVTLRPPDEPRGPLDREVSIDLAPSGPLALSEVAANMSLEDFCGDFSCIWDG